MLSEALKEEIQGAYSRLLAEKGFQARRCQKLMIADIARLLGNIPVNEQGEREPGPGICVVEAGTGTGKTIAYAMAALPLAKAWKKRLVISTATIALQEQIVNLDLPDIRKHASMDFSFALAKGRRRYLCLSRLDIALQEAGSMNHTLALYEDEKYEPLDSHRILYRDMMDTLGRGQWDGERDSWPEEMDDSAWSRVSTDHVQCTGRRCSHYENCFFYKAREKIHRVDCIVTNHDLVLADLMMGGGAVLPPPEEVIYVFDEGHHLPAKATNHFSHFIGIRSTQGWLSQIPSTLSQMSGDLEEAGILPQGIRPFEDAVNLMNLGLEDMAALLIPLQEKAREDEGGSQYRFPLGQVNGEIRALAGELNRRSVRLAGLVQGLVDRLEDPAVHDPERSEYWLPVVAAMVARLESGAALWQNYERGDPPGHPPAARWVSFREAAGQEGTEIRLDASPVSVSDALAELLWSRTFAAVITSATLSVGGDFTRFREQAGIDAGNCFVSYASPFRFSEQAVLTVPWMESDPGDSVRHTEEICELLPGILAQCQGALVLFTSWRQMLQVLDDIDREFAERILSQGTLTKAAIVSRHKERIEAGGQSCIFGLASFAEGIDLPGRYCEHVVIAKIPFAVPDDPVGATLSEWVETGGGNPFQEIMLPDAALRLVQACGRLLRTETDRGRITIMDRRLVTRRYGARLLSALPPFRRQLEMAP